MSENLEQYVRPAVLRLEYTQDVSVSLAVNCKTSSSAAVGGTTCTLGGPSSPCQTLGS